jgi:glycosyltransferase involved in cell wall biosynthesis
MGNVRIVRWNVSGLPSTLLKSQIVSILARIWIARHRHEIDIVHVDGGFTLAPSDVNTVHFVHDAWLRSPVHTSRLKKGLQKFLALGITQLHRYQESIAFRRAGTIVAVSERVRDEIAATGVDRRKIQVIHNGVDLDEFSPGVALRSKLGLPARGILVLFAGDMTTPRKNLDSLLHAIVDLDDVHVAAVGLLRGNEYPSMAKKLGLDGRVHFLGYRRDIADIMRAVDLFVFPSRYEACSLVLLEALASALPVITTSTAGGAEIVARAGGVVIEDPNSIAEIRSSIASISSDPERRKRLGLLARATAVDFSWGAMAARYEAMYRSAATEASA